MGAIRYKYNSSSIFAQLISRNRSFESCLSLFHTNIRNFKKTLDNYQTHILYELNFHFNLLAVTETKINYDNLDFNSNITYYNIKYFPTPLSAGRVGMYRNNNIQYKVNEISLELMTHLLQVNWITFMKWKTPLLPQLGISSEGIDRFFQKSLLPYIFWFMSKCELRDLLGIGDSLTPSQLNYIHEVKHAPSASYYLCISLLEKFFLFILFLIILTCPPFLGRRRFSTRISKRK